MEIVTSLVLVGRIMFSTGQLFRDERRRKGYDPELGFCDIREEEETQSLCNSTRQRCVQSRASASWVSLIYTGILFRCVQSRASAGGVSTGFYTGVSSDRLHYLGSDWIHPAAASSNLSLSHSNSKLAKHVSDICLNRINSGKSLSGQQVNKSFSSCDQINRYPLSSNNHHSSTSRPRNQGNNHNKFASSHSSGQLLKRAGSPGAGRQHRRSADSSQLFYDIATNYLAANSCGLGYGSSSLLSTKSDTSPYRYRNSLPVASEVEKYHQSPRFSKPDLQIILHEAPSIEQTDDYLPTLRYSNNQSTNVSQNTLASESEAELATYLAAISPCLHEKEIHCESECGILEPSSALMNVVSSASSLVNHQLYNHTECGILCALQTGLPTSYALESENVIFDNHVNSGCSSNVIDGLNQINNDAIDRLNPSGDDKILHVSQSGYSVNLLNSSGDKVDPLYRMRKQTATADSQQLCDVKIHSDV